MLNRRLTSIKKATDNLGKVRRSATQTIEELDPHICTYGDARAIIDHLEDYRIRAQILEGHYTLLRASLKPRWKKLIFHFLTK